MTWSSSTLSRGRSGNSPQISPWRFHSLNKGQRLELFPNPNVPGATVPSIMLWPWPISNNLWANTEKYQENQRAKESSPSYRLVATLDPSEARRVLPLPTASIQVDTSVTTRRETLIRVWVCCPPALPALTLFPLLSYITLCSNSCWLFKTTKKNTLSQQNKNKYNLSVCSCLFCSCVALPVHTAPIRCTGLQIQTPTSGSLCTNDRSSAWKQPILECDLHTCQKPFTEYAL